MYLWDFIHILSNLSCVASVFLTYFQALPIVRNLPDPIGTAAVVSQPGGAPAPGAAGAESSGGATPTSATCGSGQGYEKNVNMALNEIAMRNGCVPEWTMVSESGPQHQKVRDDQTGRTRRREKLYLAKT